jgi:hypothetical protein
VARAQTVDDSGLWFALFTQGDLGKDACCRDVKWWFDGHLRFLDDADGFNQSIVRPGVGVTLENDVTLWAGYAWIHTAPLAGVEFAEHRIWQQTTWSHDVEQVTVALRSRLEQRFVETGDDAGLRYRHLVRAQHQLASVPRLTLVAWDEVFIHLNDTDWGADAGFDQNRLFVGFGWKQHPNCRLRTEIGYLNQAINTRTGPDRVNHILSINFFH